MKQKAHIFLLIALVCILPACLQPETYSSANCKVVFEAFEELTAQLRAVNYVMEQDNEAYRDKIKAVVNDEVRSETNSVGIPDTLDIIGSRKRRLLSQIDEHMEAMKVIGEWDAVGQRLGRKEETRQNWQYWMGENRMAQKANQGRGTGAAHHLHKAYDAFLDNIEEIYNQQGKMLGYTETFNSAAYALKDHVDTAHHRNNQRWEQYTFKGPVLANMAQLEMLQANIHKMEKALMEKLGERLGVAKFEIDQFMPIIAPESRVVTAGANFQAKLFLAAVSSRVKPIYQGRGVKVHSSGDFAYLNLPADAGVIPKGKDEGKQTYAITLGMKTVTGGVEQYPISGEFIVRRPVISIRSRMAQHLYRHCGNSLAINVPGLGEGYHPECRLEGGGTIAQSNKEKHMFLVTPTGQRCVIRVSNVTGDKLAKLGEVSYRVIDPPRPGIGLFIDDSHYHNGLDPIPATAKLKLLLRSDPEFKMNYPEEAHYGISDIQVWIKPPLNESPHRVTTLKGGDSPEGIPLTLPQSVREASSGTVVYLYLLGLYRKSVLHEDIALDERFSEVERSLVFTIR